MFQRNNYVTSCIFLFVSLVLLATSSCKKRKTETIPDDTGSPTPVEIQYGTPFSQVPNTEDILLYEINERAFSSSGNFAGITARLDSIKALHVNVIWLMPIHPIGNINSVNSPYSVKNYFEVNPEFGTLEDFRTLVKEAHNRNMAVIIDWVANHTSWDNPWMQNSNWYVKDAAGNIIHPPGTNWLDVAELDFTNSEMKLEMIRAMKYWIYTANIDGYRCDAADNVPFSFWKQANDSLRAISSHKLIMLAEGSRSDHFTAGFNLNFGWNFYDKNVNVFKNNNSAVGIYPTHVNEYFGIPSGSHKLRFTSNHDKCAWEDTPLVFFGGKKGSITAFAITAFMGGVPLIYNGQEVGCPIKLPIFTKSPINWTINPDMLKEYPFRIEAWCIGIIPTY